MLDASARRKKQAARCRYKDRVKRGVRLAKTEIDAEVVDLLIETGWLSEAEASNWGAVERALSAMLADAARRRRR